jgi:hypothetical protein
MILTAAECRIALGLTGTISDLDRGLIEMLLPLVNGAIINDPTHGLMYDPEERSARVEFYPRLDAAVQSANDGSWDTNLAGTKAFFQPHGRNEILQLKHLPVREINEIKVDFQGGFGQIADTFGNDTAWTAGEDYYQDIDDDSNLNLTGHVFSRTGWPVGPGSIKVTYKSGYTENELRGRATTANASGIFHAALLTLVKAFRTIKANAKQNRVGFAAGPLASERMGDYSYSIDSSAAKAMTGMEVSVPSEAGALLASFRHYGLMVL